MILRYFLAVYAGLLATGLIACKKNDPPAPVIQAPVNKIDVSGFTRTDPAGNIIGAIDTTD